MGLRIVVFLLGILFFVQGLNWLGNPSAAAEGLGLTLPEGGRALSTMIGDIGAFFLGVGTLILLGGITQRAVWLRAGALFFGLAAAGRTIAWAAYGAEFTTPFITVEVVSAGILLFAASRAE